MPVPERAFVLKKHRKWYVLGQILRTVFQNAGLDEKAAGTAVSCSLIFFGVALTALRLFEKIAKYLAEQLDMSADEITADTTFESLGVDSLDTVEMVMDLEDELGVELELEEKIATVGELVAFIESKL
mgnify:CR=1 FL=1